MIDWVGWTIWGLRGIGWGLAFFVMFTLGNWWLFDRHPVLDFGDLKAACNFIEPAAIPGRPPQIHLCGVTWLRLCKGEVQQRFTGADGVERITIHPIKLADQLGPIGLKARDLEMPEHMPKGPYKLRPFSQSTCSWLDLMSPIVAKMPEMDGNLQ